MKKLLPCPFDAGEAYVGEITGSKFPFAVRCRKCGASTAWVKTEAIAVAKWEVRSSKIELLRFMLPRTGRVRSMFDQAVECGGLEVHKDDWKTADRLVGLGVATLGSPRGPSKDWRRLEVKGESDE